MQDDRGTPLTVHPPTGAAPPTARSPWYAGSALVLALVVVVIDQATKIWALRALTPGEPVDIVGEFLRLNIIRNPGAAFSIGNQATWLLTVLSVVILVFILASIRRLGHAGWAVCLGVLLGGALGNLVDRLFREPGVGRGHVVDFIDYGGLFVGNVADIAIVGAAAMIAVLAWQGVGLDGGRPDASGTELEPREDVDR